MSFFLTPSRVTTIRDSNDDQRIVSIRIGFADTTELSELPDGDSSALNAPAYAVPWRPGSGDPVQINGEELTIIEARIFVWGYDNNHCGYGNPRRDKIQMRVGTYRGITLDLYDFGYGDGRPTHNEALDRRVTSDSRGQYLYEYPDQLDIQQEGNTVIVTPQGNPLPPVQNGDWASLELELRLKATHQYLPGIMMGCYNLRAEAGA